MGGGAVFGPLSALVWVRVPCQASRCSEPGDVVCVMSGSLLECLICWRGRQSAWILPHSLL